MYSSWILLSAACGRSHRNSLSGKGLDISHHFNLEATSKLNHKPNRNSDRKKKKTSKPMCHFIWKSCSPLCVCLQPGAIAGVGGTESVVCRPTSPPCGHTHARAWCLLCVCVWECVWVLPAYFHLWNKPHSGRKISWPPVGHTLLIYGLHSLQNAAVFIIFCNKYVIYEFYSHGILKDNWII